MHVEHGAGDGGDGGGEVAEGFVAVAAELHELAEQHGAAGDSAEQAGDLHITLGGNGAEDGGVEGFFVSVGNGADDGEREAVLVGEVADLLGFHLNGVAAGLDEEGVFGSGGGEDALGGDDLAALDGVGEFRGGRGVDDDLADTETRGEAAGQTCEDERRTTKIEDCLTAGIEAGSAETNHMQTNIVVHTRAQRGGFKR